MKRKTALCVVLSALILLCGCISQPQVILKTPSPSAALAFTITQKQRAELQVLLQKRQDGVNNDDAAAFLSTVLPTDAVLYKEEDTLIRTAKSLKISAFTVFAISAVPKDDGFLSTIEQSYTLDGRRHRCTFEAEFKTVDTKLYYCGPAFESIENAGVKVFFSSDQKPLAQKLLNLETTVLRDMQNRYGYAPGEPVTIKIYDDQQVFLQSVKFNLPEWTGGWHEYKESIKIYNPADTMFVMSDSDYLEMLRHETAHLMVSEWSNDNAAYWLQEGMAGINESAGANAVPRLLKSELALAFTAFAKHKEIDLESLDIDEIQEVTLYYATSKAYSIFLLETFGWQKMKAALKTMQKHPYLPLTGEEKLKEGVRYTDEAIKTVFGFKSDAALQDAFDKWLSLKRKEQASLPLLAS